MTPIPFENSLRAEVHKAIWEVFIKDLSGYGRINDHPDLEIRVLSLSTDSAKDILEACGEALSRSEGRARPRCLFVDNNKSAIESVRKQAQSENLSHAIEIQIGDVSNLRTIERVIKSFDPHIVEVSRLPERLEKVDFFTVIRQNLSVNSKVLIDVYPKEGLHCLTSGELGHVLVEAGFTTEINPTRGIHVVNVGKVGMKELRSQRSARSESHIKIRCAVLSDLDDIMELEEEAFGFDPDAMAPRDLMAHRIALCNSIRPGWFWVAEHRGKVVADLVLQPTNLEPVDIKSWSSATTEGKLDRTFDPDGRNIFVVSFASARTDIQPAATALLGHQGLLLWLSERKRALMFCSRMPGFSTANQSSGISAENYWCATRPDGTPKDWLLKEFYHLVASNPYMLLRDGYPPDKASGGHGVLFAALDPVAALHGMASRIYRAGLASESEQESEDVESAHGS